MEVGAFDRDIEDTFKKATDFVSKAKFKASNDDKLTLYGYFKQATVGPCNIPKPGFLYFEEKAKWYEIFMDLDYFWNYSINLRFRQLFYIPILCYPFGKSRFKLINYNEIQYFVFFDRGCREKWNALGKMNKDEAMEQYVQTLTALVPDWQSSDYKPVSHVVPRACRHNTHSHNCSN